MNIRLIQIIVDYRYVSIGFLSIDSPAEKDVRGGNLPDAGVASNGNKKVHTLVI